MESDPQMMFIALMIATSICGCIYVFFIILYYFCLFYNHFSSVFHINAFAWSINLTTLKEEINV